MKKNILSVPTDNSSSDKSSCFSLPVEFRAENPGHYPCLLTVQAQDDIRVYKLECSAIPEGNQAVISFRCPVHQSTSQNIPVVGAIF